jgi:hypothetical protein
MPVPSQTLSAALIAASGAVAPWSGMAGAAGRDPVLSADFAALAPDRIVMREGAFLLHPTHGPEAEAERLDRAAVQMPGVWAGTGRLGQVWLGPPGHPAVLEIGGDAQAGRCLIAVPIESDALAAALAQPADPLATANPAPTTTMIGDAPALRDRLTHMAFATGAFAGRTVLQLIHTPRSASRTDPARGSHDP